MEYCEFIKKVQSYQQNINVIRIDGRYTIDENTFNINTLVGFFDKLYLKAGYRIDCYYEDRAMHNDTILYWITEGEHVSKIYENNSKGYHFDGESKNKGELNSQEYRDLVYNRKIKNIIVPEDSKLGFLQYLFLMKFGNQLGLIGHSNYYKKAIVCNHGQVLELLNENRKRHVIFVNEDKLERIKEIPLQPTIIQENNSYQITYFEYRHLKGVYKCKYEIDRVKPFEIELLSTDRVLPVGSNLLAY